MIKQINNQLAQVHEQYIEQVIEPYAKLVFNAHIVPVCVKKKLSYTTMNGFPRFYNRRGNSVDMPDSLEPFFHDVYIGTGQPLFVFFPDFNPANVDFSELDIKNFRKEMESVTFNQAALGLIMTSMS